MIVWHTDLPGQLRRGREYTSYNRRSHNQHRQPQRAGATGRKARPASANITL
jgi:hypothetical protein